MRKLNTRIRKAFELMRQVAANPDQFPHRFVALPLDPEIIASIFTPERIRLLKLVQERGPYEKVEDLARAAHRDVSIVSRDLKVLSQAGLVATPRRGKRKMVRGTNRPLFFNRVPYPTRDKPAVSPHRPTFSRPGETCFG